MSGAYGTRLGERRAAGQPGLPRTWQCAPPPADLTQRETPSPCTAQHGFAADGQF
jgi:hypothetical protein